MTTPDTNSRSGRASGHSERGEAHFPLAPLTASLEISPRRIADLMVTALEHNDMVCAWVAAARLRSPTEEDLYERTKNNNWYDVPELWAGEFEIDVYEISDESEYETFDPEEDEVPDGITKHTITHKDLAEALKIWPSSKYAHHFAEFIRENEDAITADVFLQLVVLKEVVYG